MISVFLEISNRLKGNLSFFSHIYDKIIWKIYGSEKLRRTGFCRFIPRWTMLSNKRPHALITGASRGIGAAATEIFARSGYSVTIFYRSSADKADDLVVRLLQEGCDAIAVQVDIRDYYAVRAAVHKANLQFGAVDVLVSNAGIASQKLFTDVTPDEFREMMDTHVTGLYNIVEAVLPGMISRKTGSIVTVSSIWGITGASCEVAYSTAKAAVIGFTKALAKEVGPSNIRVNCVAPGVVDTDMNRGLSAEDMEMLCEETPLERIGTPEEIAETILFLASPKASFITGQVISPNGGLVI
jgi:3-oxoacyl-[acyl-carrier protein] reductase